MPIRSGIGIGEAQVYDTSSLANQYIKQVAIDQASLQKQALLNQKRNDDYLKELATTISSAKTLGNGLHPQDAEAIIGYQDKFKELYEKAATAKTDKERKILQAEVESGFQKANAYVNGAKMFRKNLDDVVRQITDYPYDFTDEQKKEVQKVYNAPYNQALTDGTAGINVLTYKRTPDFSEITKSVSSLDKIAEDLSVNSPKRRFAIPITGQNIQDSSQYMAEIDPKSLFDNSLLLVQGNNKLKSSLKSEYEIKNPNATEVPDDNQLAGMLVGKYEEHKGGKDKAYIVGGTVFKNPKEPAVPKDSESEKETKLWENYTQGAFNPNTRNQYIKNLQILAGDKAKLSITPEGYVKVIGSPEQKLNVGSGLSVLTPAPSPKEYIAKDPSQLIGHLKNVGVNPKGISSIERLNKSNNTSTPSSSRRAQDGYRINQVEGGYKYIGGPADDKNSWVKI